MSDENATPLDDEQPTAADSAPLNADAIDEGVAAQDEGGAGPGAGGLALLAMALLVLAGGAVYLLGSVMSADSDTADAQAAAEEQIAQFDPNEFESNFTEEDLAPIDSIPLADDETDSTAGSSDSSDTAESSVSTTTTVAPFEGIDPSTVGLIFVNRVPGEDYGKVGYIDRNAERHIVDLECVRIDWNVNGGLCLDHGTSVSPGTGYLLAPDLEPTTRFDLSLPSRTAVSPNGGVMAWTGFTLGHSYLNPGEFATITQLISVERETGRNLEEVWETYLPTGELLSSEDQNYWGVTFIDDERFYATVGHSGTTDIVEGSLLDPRLEVVFEGVSCPEVSPDGSTVVVKEMQGDAFFQLVAIDVETGQRRDLGETRSVDDQVEWLDDDRIVYGMPNAENGTDAQPAFDIWVLDVSAGSQPQLLVPFADSPAAP